MTLDQIETFITVADTGSFKAASEKLHRSQPALSVAVKKLEEELGIKLFSRDQYRPQLTKEGKAFYQKSRELFLDSQSLERFAKKLGMGEEAEVSVAIDGLCPLSSVLDVLRLFSEEHPDTRLHLNFEVLAGAADKVQNGKVDMALSPKVGLESGAFETQPLFKVEMVPVLSGSTTLLNKGQKIKVKELKELPQIIVRDTSTQPNLRSFGVLEGGRQWSVQDLTTKKEIIMANLGWGRLPEHLIEAELKEKRLVELELQGIKRETVDIVLLTSPSHPLGPLGSKLKNLFISKASSV